MLFNNAIETAVWYFCNFRSTLWAKLDSWEWKLLIISSQFVYTNELILQLWTTFYESFYPLRMTKFEIQRVQQMTEMA
jgi:hypothetical protein